MIIIDDNNIIIISNTLVFALESSRNQTWYIVVLITFNSSIKKDYSCCQ